MRLIGYVRAGAGSSVESQTETIRAAAGLRGFPLLDVITDDAEESAGDIGRAGLVRLLALAEARQIDGVIIASLDRITRNAIDGDKVMGILDKNNVRFISVAEDFDTGTPVGRRMKEAVSMFAAMELEARADRIRKAMGDIKSSACPVGMPPYGWKAQGPKGNSRGPRMPLVRDEYEQHAIRVILQLHRQGDSYRKIADQLIEAGYTNRGKGKWAFSVVRKIILANHDASVS